MALAPSHTSTHHNVSQSDGDGAAPGVRSTPPPQHVMSHPGEKEDRKTEPQHVDSGDKRKGKLLPGGRGAKRSKKT